MSICQKLLQKLFFTKTIGKFVPEK